MRKHKTRKSINTPGHAHELTFSCHGKRPLLAIPGAAETFLQSLDAARSVHAFQVWAYIVMPNHVHLLVWPQREVYNISMIIKSIKQRSAQNILKQLRETHPALVNSLIIRWPTGRTETRFWQQGGGYDRNVFSPEAIRASIDYIHANPARTGSANIEEYIYSSFGAYHSDEPQVFRVDRWHG